MSQPDLGDITQRVIAITSEQLGLPIEQISPDSRLVEDLNCDSLDVVELIMEVEDEFKTILPDDSDDPVYKAVFTRIPFRISDFAELVFVQLGDPPSESNVSGRWLADEERMPAGSVAFTQLIGGTAHGGTDSMYEPLGIGEDGLEMYRRRVDGMRCVLVPGGLCEIGSDTKERDEAPSHEVELSPFLLDAEAVCVGAYARFLNSIGMTDEATLRDWFVLDECDRRGKHLPIRFSDEKWVAEDGTARWPMILVSWYGANAYSLWANGRDPSLYRESQLVAERQSTLPSEAQWEYAARGSARQEYPWGDDPPEASRARFGCHRRGQDYAISELPICDVNVTLGRSPFGMLHMAGNVWQWCADWYDAAFYRSSAARGRDPINMSPTGVRAERGGSWIGTGALLRSSYRRGRNPIARGRCLGFRCCGVPPR